MKGKKMKIYCVNANTMSNKLATVYDIVQKREMDIIMINEAGLNTRKAPTITGYTVFRTDHEHKNRVSLVYLRNMYTDVTLNIVGKEDKTVESEIIHLRVKGEPCCNIICVYLESNMNKEDAEKTHRILQNKVDAAAKVGEDVIVMGDCNAPMNPNTNSKVPAIQIIKDWEKSGKVIILNDKSRPTRVPTQKDHQANCVDLAMVTPGILARGVTFTLDETREWTPTKVEPTGEKAPNGDLIYEKTTPSDHMAMEAEIKVNIVMLIRLQQSRGMV